MLIDFDQIQSYIDQLSVHRIKLPENTKLYDEYNEEHISILEQLNFIFLFNLAAIRNYSAYFIREIENDHDISSLSTSWDDCLLEIEIELKQPYVFQQEMYSSRYLGVISSNEYLFFQKNSLFLKAKILKVLFFEKIEGSEKAQLENVSTIVSVVEEDKEKVQEIGKGLFLAFINNMNLEHRMFVAEKIKREFILVINHNIEKILKQNKKVILIQKDEIYYR